MFTQFGECHHRDRKCHGLRNASRVHEKRTCQICGYACVSNHSAENRESWSRIEKSAGWCCFMKTVKGTLHRSMSARIQMRAWEPHRDDVVWKLQTMFRAGSWSAHALREQGGTLTEDVQLRGSKRAVERVSWHARVFLKLRCGKNESTRALAERQRLRRR